MKTNKKPSKTFLKKIAKELHTQRAKLLNTDYQVDDIDMDGDETDIIQGNQLAEMGTHLSNRNSLKLSQIAAALQRLENNTYGLCEECEDPIPEKRLQVNPYCLTCISCAEEREMETRRARREMR